MPAVPSCLLEPPWDQFAALLPARGAFVADHPLCCHSRRVADRTVFEHIVLALVRSSGYERISSPGCSDLTIRRGVKECAELGISEKVHVHVLEAYDRTIGLGLAEISVDGCITKAPSGGEKAGLSPVERGKRLKRSVASDACGVPLGIVSNGANRQTRPCSARPWRRPAPQGGTIPEGVNVSLDRGYDSAKSRALIADFGFTSEIAHEGVPAPIQAGKRWVIERTHSCETSEVLQSAAGQINGRRVDKHESSWRTDDLGREPVYQELSSRPPPGRRPNHPSGWKGLTVVVGLLEG